MAAARRRLVLLCLALLLLGAPPPPSCQASRALDRRFAEYKRCADPECSMLMCRGKAVKDYKGPDCRFVDFKEGESVYVYYKLSGRTNDLWAGSVGSDFGYFPKDLLEINHIYTHDEVEVPADETDFICFQDGKDDFDNYNVDELLKLSEDIVDSDTKDDLENEKEEETEKTDPTESIYPESDGLEVDSEESSEDYAEMSEQDNFIFEKNKNVEGSLDSKSENPAVNSDTDNPQGDQSAQQPSEDMLQEMLKVPQHESAKNATISQGGSKQSDFGSKNDSAYKPLHQEVSEDLKTTFGSTADALVSDDETTSLVTSFDGDAEQDLDIDSYDVENLKEPQKESEEIPLLSFTKEDVTSDVKDPEADNMSFDDIFESETSDPDVGTREAPTKLSYEKKDDSGLLTHIGDKIFAIVSGGERRTDEDKDDLEEEEEEEEDNEVAVISKKENEDVFAHSETSAEGGPLTLENDPKKETKKVHNVDDRDPKEESYKTQEEEHEKSGVEPTAEKLKSKSMHNFGAFSNYGDGLQSKASIEAKEETLKPPLGDIKDDPEGLSLHKIIKDKERERKKHLEDSLENDTKHKIVWDKLGKTEDEKEKSVNIVSELLEELINESQSDMDDGNVVEGKTEYTKQDVKNSELKMVLGEKQLNVSAMENVPIEKNIEENIKESKQEREVQYSEEEEEEENDLTSSKEILEKRSVMEKSMQATQHGNFTQQNIVQNEVEQSSTDRGMDGKELPKAEAQSLELDPEEDNFPEDPEEELLQDENALSAKMSKETLAADQSFTSDDESASLQPQMPKDAISGAANPYDYGEEAITTLEQAKREDSMQDFNKENEGMQINEDSPLNEVKESKDKEEKHFMVDEKITNLDMHDKLSSSRLNIPELEDKKNDLKESEQHLQEDFSQKSFKDKQFSAEGKLQNSHDPSGPVGVSEHTDEATEPEYSESVRQLTIMKEFLDAKRVARLQKYLAEQHMFRIESLFHDMELELMLAQKHDNFEDTEKALDEILETSESNILDIVNDVLDSRAIETKEEVIQEIDLFDEEAALMDDIQELMYSLRQKYSPISESTPLASLPQSEMDSGVSITANAKQAEHHMHSVENTAESTDQNLPGNTKHMSQEDSVLQLNQPEDENILTETETLDETEDPKILNSDKTLPRVDTVLGSDDSGRTTERDLIADIIGAKEDTVEEGSNPSKADSDDPHTVVSLGASAFSVKDILRPFTKILVSTLPEEMRPGPDFHGLPWEPIIITALVGFATLAILFWRSCLSVKSRMYQVTEKQLVEKIKILLKEKAEILEKMSEYDQKINEAKQSVKEARKQNTNLTDEASGLKDTVKGLKETNHLLDDRVRNLHTMLEMEKEQNVKKQEQITETQKSLGKLQEVISLHSVELSEVQIALNEAKLSEGKAKSELRRTQEENVRLKKSKEQLLQEAEGWSERHTELSEQIKLYQKSQKDIEEALAYKENEIEVLTNCIMQLKQLDADSESEGKRDAASDVANGELSDTRNEKMKNQIKQMMDVSRVKTTLSIIEEEKNHLQSKLNDEIAARHELEEQIKKLEHDSSSLQTTKSQLENECKTLHQKAEILNELYQQKEMALQKKLTQEEYERHEKEQKLSVADEKAVLAVEEVKIYKQRIQEIEEELQKTERSYKNQIAGHEKKAHENWLLARSAERALAEEKREAANLRQKLIEVNQKIAALQSPLIVKPTAGRPDYQVFPRRGPLSRDGSFGPSPVSGGAPSPPLMMEPPGRPLSANPREGSRGELSATDGPPLPRRHPELSGRMSVPDLGPAIATLVNCGPRTSSPSSVQDGMQNPPKECEAPSVSVPLAEATAVNMGPKGPTSFSGTPIMTSPATGPLPPPVRFGPPPHRAPYGPRPLPLSLVRGGLPLPIPRDYPPGPPFGMRDFPPGPLPPPDQRGYLRGPPPPFRPPPHRDYPPGPRLPPQGLRDYPPPPARDLPPSAPSDYQGGPPCPPSPAGSRDSAHNPEQKP